MGLGEIIRFPLFALLFSARVSRYGVRRRRKNHGFEPHIGNSAVRGRRRRLEVVAVTCSPSEVGVARFQSSLFFCFLSSSPSSPSSSSSSWPFSFTFLLALVLVVVVVVIVDDVVFSLFRRRRLQLSALLVRLWHTHRKVTHILAEDKTLSLRGVQAHR